MSTAPPLRRRPQKSGLIDRQFRHSDALLIVDMISCWTFPDGRALSQQAANIAPAIAALKRRCHSAHVPVIYANDNSGQWRSDFKFVVCESRAQPGEAASITKTLEPTDEDFFILKPKHSAFFATPLEILLDHLGACRLIVTGVSSDQCVMNTVMDARMRDFEVVVPRDCVASQSEVRSRRAMAHLDEVLGVPTPKGRHVQLTKNQEPH